MASTSQHDWSLHRKGPVDQKRHDEKIKEAIKQNLPEIIAEESIITSDGKRLIKVPIRSLEEYRFRFDPNQGEKVGQGAGDSKVGDVLGQKGPGNQPGQGKQAGDGPGVDYYEAEVTVDDLAELIFEDLGLPDLRPKQTQDVPTDTVKFTEIRKTGPMSNLDKRRTIMENLKRNAINGEPTVGNFKNDDLRFKVWEQETRPSTAAVVIAMRDASGSMGEFKKYITRSLFFWMVRFLRTKYQNVEIVFITHHSEACVSKNKESAWSRTTLSSIGWCRHITQSKSRRIEIRTIRTMCYPRIGLGFLLVTNTTSSNLYRSLRLGPKTPLASHGRTTADAMPSMSLKQTLLFFKFCTAMLAVWWGMGLDLI